jgi:FkbM family methyltransferase
LSELIIEDQRRRAGDDFFFVQIGACDGVSFDGLYDTVRAHQLRGIVIEPLPDLYRELCANYADTLGVKPINVAIHRTEKEIEMYRVAPGAEGLPGWTKGTASLFPDRHKRWNMPSEHIVAEKVRCVTWDELVEQNGIIRIDFLQLDTEGYDYEILQMLDYEKLRPAVVKFEHNVAGGDMSAAQLAECVAKLVRNNYHILTMASDLIAYSRLDAASAELGGELMRVTPGDVELQATLNL